MNDFYALEETYYIRIVICCFDFVVHECGVVHVILINKMSLVLRKPVFCICENKDVDQLRGDREADQRLCFRYTDSTIPLLSKSEISSL